MEQSLDVQIRTLENTKDSPKRRRPLHSRRGRRKERRFRCLGAAGQAYTPIVKSCSMPGVTLAMNCKARVSSCRMNDRWMMRGAAETHL